MLTTAVLTGLATHAGWGWGGGAGWLFLLIPLFWIAFFVLLFWLLGRRWRRGWGGPGGGPGGPGYYYGGGHPGWQAQADARSAEKTLAERFAQGDIDEVEYRARLEVLRANRPDASGPGGASAA
jgi:putative membrane protein